MTGQTRNIINDRNYVLIKLKEKIKSSVIDSGVMFGSSLLIHRFRDRPEAKTV